MKNLEQLNKGLQELVETLSNNNYTLDSTIETLTGGNRKEDCQTKCEPAPQPDGLMEEIFDKFDRLHYLISQNRIKIDRVNNNIYDRSDSNLVGCVKSPN